jgi:hypothetical protein
MADTQQQIAELSKKITELETKMGGICGEVAELRTIMGPFITRYQTLILPFYEALAGTQREIADRRVAMGDKSAIHPGEPRSPLDRFFEDPNVQEQYERAWQGKKAPRASGPLHLTAASPEIKSLYAGVVAHLHPELAKDKAERERRRQIMTKVDEAYVRRDQISLQAMVDTYQDRSNLLSEAPDDVVAALRERVVLTETAIGKVEGQKFDLRYGLIAKIKAYAEQLWAEEKRDLLGELSREVQRSLDAAQAELETLRASGG